AGSAGRDSKRHISQETSPASAAVSGTALIYYAPHRYLNKRGSRVGCRGEVARHLKPDTRNPKPRHSSLISPRHSTLVTLTLTPETRHLCVRSLITAYWLR